MSTSRTGFTLVEMLVSVGLFAVVMLMASSAYLVIVAGNRQAQAVGSASDNLSFALETMTRSIRTGTTYSCGAGGDCYPVAGSSFSFTDSSGKAVTYGLSGGAIVETINGTSYALTDASVAVSRLSFYVQGTANPSGNDYREPQVLISISGSVSSGPGKTFPFTIESGATMRTLDIGGAAPSQGGTHVIVLTSGTSWQVPADWNSANNTIEVIGGGGGGSGYASSGGGGGAYAKVSNVPLSGGTTVTYSVGIAGFYDSINGGDTYLCNSSSNCASIAGSAVVVGAKGGKHGWSYNDSPFTAATAGLGGEQAGNTGSVGTVIHKGGTGGTGTAIGGSPNNGGGGGGGAGGPNGDGANGVNATNQNGGAGGRADGATGAAGGSGGSGCTSVGCTANSGVSGTNGTEWTTYGAGGGGGGGGGAESGNSGVAGNPGNGGGYGGGAGGDGDGATNRNHAGTGGQGIIVITYTSL